ncbi:MULTISPECIES: LruC domain-containing protein [unclassified Photobacterium]|uniref:LruC domain-containing protein n=1 Tax=unclassified Photobacterium TaxID=2628852 RepID=UPI001EDE31C8|nr:MULTISPECIES: LruC domain-containing protein [unclassified Photobacterium]MCG3865704.1 LruC domain-containing protein [Photobacterium sp. Ph6]MCG3877205.1 LruC domain-containing protein [Photobacterium sp. Ph5]
MMYHFFVLSIPLLFTFFTGPASANSFSSCPSNGYLFHQSNSVSLIDIDRRTSHQGVVVNTYDAVGFNDIDSYIYGVQNKQVVRIHNNFIAETLIINGLPEHGFTAGDVHNNKLYLYAQNEGLWEVDLTTQSASQRLKKQYAVYSFADLAIHPSGKIYAVDNSKNIHRFDLSQSLENNQIDITASVGLTGVRNFSGQFFDDNGMFYVIDANSGDTFLFNQLTPFSVDDDFSYLTLLTVDNVANTIDIARCNNAPLSTLGYDMGDAPNSYQTSRLVNGARHQVSSQLYLGLQPDEDLFAQFYPMHDDNDLGNDDQGIIFTTPTLNQGSTTYITAHIGGITAGYLSGWVDWNNNGNFDDANEQVIDNILLNSGEHTLAIDVPIDSVITDSTWSRFRINSSPNTAANGPGENGEVEDYPLTITGFDTQESYFWFPSQGNFATLAFEDRWPTQDDYDFNDVVLKYRVGHVQETATGKLSKLTIDIELQAYGAGYNNGFAVKLDGISSSSIDVSKSFVIINGEYHNTVLEMTENPDDDAVLILTNALKQYFSSDCDNGFLRVDPSCELDKNERVTASMKVSFTTPVTYPEHLHPYLNPFIFAAPNEKHGFDSPPARSLEIHLKNFSPTLKADQGLFNSEHDHSMNTSVNCSVENNCNSYKNKTGIPFAILVPSDWKHPIEGKSVLSAYPSIENYLSSNEHDTWFMHPESSKVYSLTAE